MSAWKSGSNFDAFHSLDANKQARIINAALNEFGVKGFKQASTNVIAENAQIGKGMLFYYFGSKEELFNFLCQYTIEFIREKYVSNFDCKSGDFIERYITLSDVKRGIMGEFPEAFGLLESFFHEENAPYFENFAPEIAEIRQKVYEKIYDGIDYSLFREDMDGKTVVKYMKWLFAAYELETTERFKRNDFDIDNPQEAAAEWSKFYAFTDDLRKTYYKMPDKEEKSNANH